MAVSALTIQFIIISICFSILTPILLTIIFRIKQSSFTFKPLLFGILTWIIATQLLEKILHFFVLSFTPLLHFPYLFALYGGLTAGIFEEGGRYLVFKKFLKAHHKWIDGVSYGIGHGGIESITIGIVGSLQTLLLAIAINTNNITPYVKTTPFQTLQTEVKTLVATPSYLFMLSGVERIFSLFIQIAFSILVLYAIQTKRKRFLFYAILLHALIDIPASLAQMRILDIWTVERIVCIFFLLSLVFIKRSQKMFERNSRLSNTSSS